MADEQVPNFNAMPIFENTFYEGMRQDTDPQLRKKSTYLYSINGRVFYNKDGDAAWRNEQGNDYSFSLNNALVHQGVEGYVPIGYCEFPDYTLIFSTNEINSEIGILDVQSSGGGAIYITIFNDLYDPNGETLDWSLEHKIKASIPSVESSVIHRSYGTDGYTEPFCINTQVGLSANSPEFISGNYTPLGGYGVGNIYPWFYSVHSIHFQADIIFGKLRMIDATVAGNLKTGAYQYAYRGVTRDGYRTPWSILSRPFLCTFDDSLYGNSMDRCMQPSNLYSAKSFSLEIHNIDTRFYKIEMAYIYSIDYNATVECYVFEEIELNVTDHPELVGGDLNVNHTENGGIPFNPSEFNKKIVPIKRCQSINQKDNIFWLGGIEVYGDFLPDTSDVVISEHIAQVEQDENTSSAIDTTPFVDSSITNDIITIRAFANADTAITYNNYYDVVNDYYNFKGIQTCNVLRSYFPDEVYPIGYLAIDIKGNPYYVKNILDFQVNKQYPMTTPGYLNSIGLNIQSIDITDNIYDSETGKQKLGGFSIVRCKRIPQILMQAICFPTVFNEDDTDQTYLLPFASNRFVGAASTTPNSLKYDTAYSYDSGKDWYSRPYTYVLHSPELSFEYDIYQGTNQSTVNEDNDVLTLIYFYASTYENNSESFNKVVELDGANYSFYTKNYTDGNPADYTSVQELYDDSLFRLEGQIGFGSTIPNYDPDDTALQFNGESFIWTAALGYQKHCYSARYGWLVKGKSFKNLNIYKTDNTNNCVYYIADYKVKNTNYYNTDFINNRLYIPTGHFQPLTSQVIAEATYNDSSVKFEGIQFFGGDVFPVLFDFVHNYVRYNQCNSPYEDYAVAAVIPMYSNLNIALRKGRSFSSVGIEPEKTSCGGASVFDSGVLVNQPEEFNLNSVVLLQENVQFFPGKPNNENIDQTKFPYRWCYSLTKTLGEKYDNYREILTANFGDVQGQYGNIVGSAKIFNQLYCIQEKGFGRIRSLDRSVISTNNGEAVNTGLGKVFDSIDYISTKHGTTFPYSILQSYKAFCFIDTSNDCMVRFSQNGVDEITEIYSMKYWAMENLGDLNRDFISVATNQAEHICGIFDEVRDEFIWNIYNKFEDTVVTDSTIVFSNNTQLTCFTGFLPNKTWQFIPSNGHIYSSKRGTDSEEYRMYGGNRGQWYGVNEDSEIWFTVNDRFELDKKFDNILMNINEIGGGLIAEVILETETQVHTIDMTTFTEKIWRKGFLRFPIREPGKTDRLEGHYMIVKIKFKNELDKEIKFVSNQTKLRYVRALF